MSKNQAIKYESWLLKKFNYDEDKVVEYWNDKELFNDFITEEEK